MGTHGKHITELCQHSLRIDFYPATPSLLVTVPNHHCHRDCVNEIARVEVSRISVAHTLRDRHTARLEQPPAQGAMVSIYWAHPGEWSHKVWAYLRDSETSEEFQTRLLRGYSSSPLQPSETRLATTPPPALGYGLQRPSTGLQRHPK